MTGERTTPVARPREARLFGVRFDLFTRDELRAWTRSLLAAPPAAAHVAFANSEFLLEARRNQRFQGIGKLPRFCPGSSNLNRGSA